MREWITCTSVYLSEVIGRTAVREGHFSVSGLRNCAMVDQRSVDI